MAGLMMKSKKTMNSKKPMKSKKSLTLIGSTLAALTLSAVVIASPGNRDGSCHRFNGDPEQRQEMMQKHAERRLAKMKRYLDLTDDQTEQLKTLFAQNRPEKGQTSSPKSIHRAMRDLDPTDSEYQSQVDELIKSAQKQMAERMQARATMRQQVYQLLTPEQRSKLEEMEERRHSKGGKGFKD